MCRGPPFVLMAKFWFIVLGSSQDQVVVTLSKTLLIQFSIHLSNFVCYEEMNFRSLLWGCNVRLFFRSLLEIAKVIGKIF